MKWIALKNVLPGFGIAVLVSDKKDVWIDALYRTTTYRSQSGETTTLSWDTHGDMVNATHWMPLPEPPK